MAASISALEVRNFRSCRELMVTLSAYTPIVGRNNCGKSNVVAALSWLVRKSTLDATDFNDPTQPVEIAGTLSSITELSSVRGSEEGGGVDGRVGPQGAGRLGEGRMSATLNECWRKLRNSSNIQ